jgi:glucose-6-phosphate dehydrogenase assembly protein OpcA
MSTHFAKIADKLNEMFAEQLIIGAEQEEIMQKQGRVITELSDKIITANKILDDFPKKHYDDFGDSEREVTEIDWEDDITEWRKRLHEVLK